MYSNIRVKLFVLNVLAVFLSMAFAPLLVIQLFCISVLILMVQPNMNLLKYIVQFEATLLMFFSLNLDSTWTNFVIIVFCWAGSILLFKTSEEIK